MEAFMNYEIYSNKIDAMNFREVCMGAIAPQWLYRSSHPITCGRQDLIIAELSQRAGIAVVLNLSDDEATLARKVSFVPWYHRLFREDRIITLDMNYDIFGGDFGKKINRGVQFIVDHDGPYLIHCLQGIDRTGFFVLLLEMLMGADKEEIIDDYMASFLGRPEFEKGSYHYKQERGFFIDVLKKLSRGKPVKNDVLPGIAEKYLLENAGLARPEVDLLKARLQGITHVTQERHYPPG
jgi:hypothetical protein